MSLAMCLHAHLWFSLFILIQEAARQLEQSKRELEEEKAKALALLEKEVDSISDEILKKVLPDDWIIDDTAEH